ncbi:MAG: ABC transporter permease, partial [Sphingobacteriaceae bacterium]
MYKLIMSIYKEMLLLKRDPGGLVVLFVMPLVLIITITLIQDSTF